jgi:hypothetical protein
MPGNTIIKGTNPAIANQIDIIPSVLTLLNYPYPYYSIGKSLFTPGDTRFAITYNEGIYQYIDSSCCYQFNGHNAVGFYNLGSDSLLVNNLYRGKMNNRIFQCDRTLKKMVQLFNQSMINNKVNLETIIRKN